MRSILDGKKKLSALAGVTEGEVQPFITGTPNVLVTLLGGEPVTSPLTLHGFDVPAGQCAVITEIEFSSVPISDDPEFQFPTTLADYAGRREFIGWLNKVRVALLEGSDTRLPAYTSSIFPGSEFFVLIQPGGRVTVSLYPNSEGVAEDTEDVYVTTTVRGFLLPARARNALSGGNTILLPTTVV
jgi:hypothetical protein